MKKLLNRKIVTKDKQEAEKLATTKKWRYSQNRGTIKRQTLEGSSSKL
jgi:hypothetical protein